MGPRKAKERELPAGAAGSPPSLCGPGASGRGRSSHTPLTAVAAPGLGRPPHGFLFYSGLPWAGCSSPAISVANGQWGFRRRAQRRVGKGEQHLLPPRPSSCDIHFKVTGGASLSLLPPCRPGTLFPHGDFEFQRFWWLGSQVGLERESRCLLSACHAPDAHRSRRPAAHRWAGLQGRAEGLGLRGGPLPSAPVFFF